MSLIKKIKDKKVNFEFNKEYINVVTSKIANNDALFITNSFKEIHPADAADIIEHLDQNDREKLIKLNKEYAELKRIVDTISTFKKHKTDIADLKILLNDQDNTIKENIIPIDMLRLKLSFFGALKFDPRSDKWLRICMFQGAPLPNELKNYDEQWVYKSHN